MTLTDAETVLIQTMRRLKIKPDEALARIYTMELLKDVTKCKHAMAAEIKKAMEGLKEKNQ